MRYIQLLWPAGENEMTQDEIIRMAREAGLIRQRGNLDIVTHSITQIERFAALVAAHEREACAKVCEKMAPRTVCAAAIRARGDK